MSNNNLNQDNLNMDVEQQEFNQSILSNADSTSPPDLPVFEYKENYVGLDQKQVMNFHLKYENKKHQLYALKLYHDKYWSYIKSKPDMDIEKAPILVRNFLRDYIKSNKSKDVYVDVYLNSDCFKCFYNEKVGILTYRGNLLDEVDHDLYVNINSFKRKYEGRMKAVETKKRKKEQKLIEDKLRNSKLKRPKSDSDSDLEEEFDFVPSKKLKSKIDLRKERNSKQMEKAKGNSQDKTGDKKSDSQLSNSNDLNSEVTFSTDCVPSINIPNGKQHPTEKTFVIPITYPTPNPIPSTPINKHSRPLTSSSTGQISLSKKRSLRDSNLEYTESPSKINLKSNATSFLDELNLNDSTISSSSSKK